jgi:ATP-dependent helicase/nuclease subunit A
LEADIPPGFDLLEDTSLIERQAWQALFSEANKKSKLGNQLSEHLDVIMRICNGPDNTFTALSNFLKQRSDWWAYTAHSSTPVEFACEQLALSFKLDQTLTTKEKNPVEIFLNDIQIKKLMVFANLLREIKNKTSEKHAGSIDAGLKENNPDIQFALIKSAFIKKDGDILLQGRQLNASLEKKLGAEQTSRFIELHHDIAESIQQTSEQVKRLLSLKINTAWYFSGQRYVEIFQQLKREMRLLDFTDLEWKCYELLQHADNAHWIQYKIDQRIDHILIDEFQDTNPTQWHLLSPILDEIAAGPEERRRSVFIVGDEKQSIYSFRRANPALQDQASEWLAENLNAKATPLDFSRRSSAAIINSVNQIFQQTDIQAIMTGFTTHDTYLKNLPGQVMLCDLFANDAEDNEEHDDIYFRNPLKQPHETNSKTLRHTEAEYIAEQILALKNTPSLVTENEKVRPVEFGDIMILMRNRTHIAIYEQALKQKGIPYIGSKKGGLLDNLEIQDLICLLNTLIAPFNNLAFAQVLKSPIFDVSDDDLIQLAREKTETHWYERLMQLASDHIIDSTHEISTEMQRAAMLLPRWQAFAEQLPVHDCLDKIFSQGNIINRYIATNKEQNKLKVAANCQRFLELSLETDSGRYPSITRFLQHLLHLKNYSASPPEEPLSQSTESRVRLMTIHASKGLESPIVFLADCNNTASNRNAYDSLVRWPASKSQPTHFQLQLSKENTDQITQNIQQEKRDEQAREELNLLYVALTRAREQLYISGNASTKKQDNSWYQIIARGLENANAQITVNNVNCKVIEHLSYGSNIDIKTTEKTNQSESFKIDDRLLKPLSKDVLRTNTTTAFMISPSSHSDKASSFSHPKAGSTKAENQHNGELAKWRGIVIHRFIELLCNKNQYPAKKEYCNEIFLRLRNETSLTKPDYIHHLDECLQEAITTFNSSLFEDIFNTVDNSTSFNEMPLMYKQKKQAVYGFVDRVIKTEKTVTILDYKSHQLAPTETALEVAQQSSKQLNDYVTGIKKIWPKHKIKAGILFTHHQEIIWLV